MSTDSRLANVELGRDAVRHRFRRGLRQGNSEWLWPDTDPLGWQAAVRDIEHVVRGVLAGDRAIPVLKGHPQNIGIACFTSGMGPLLGFWAAEGLLEAEPAVRAVLDLHYSQNLRRMQRLAESALVVVDALFAAGIEVTVLKGMHTAYSFFPTPGCRPMSDIDLLVRSTEESKAGHILEDLGYLPAGGSYGEKSFRMVNSPRDSRSLSFLHEDDPWSIDLHVTLDRRYTPGAPMIHMDRVVETAAKGAWPLSPKANNLTGEELVVYLANHASQGLVSLSLLRMSELIFIIRRLESDGRFTWDRVLQMAERSGVLSCIYPALCMIAKMIPGTVPDHIVGILERNAPLTVRKVMAHLEPATCQRLLRNSIKERFMWTNTKSGWTREIVQSVFPPTSLDQLGTIYARRFFMLLRGRIRA